MPDLAAFGKAIVTVIHSPCWKARNNVQVGGDIFFCNLQWRIVCHSTAIATINKLEKTDAVRRIHLLGQRMMNSLNALSNSGLDGMIKYSGEWYKSCHE